MKFGYFCNTTNWDHKPYKQLLDETKEITTYCDENNWDSIWYTEHHFNHEGMESCTNPLMMCTDAAARTKNIRLGQACNVITLHACPILICLVLAAASTPIIKGFVQDSIPS